MLAFPLEGGEQSEGGWLQLLPAQSSRPGSFPDHTMSELSQGRPRGAGLAP